MHGAKNPAERPQNEASTSLIVIFEDKKSQKKLDLSPEIKN
jgi:hypothetical protein